MNKEYALQAMADILVSMLILKLREFNTNAKVGEVYADEVFHFAQVRRTGIYGWLEADDGKEYGYAVSIPNRVASFHTVHELKRYAKQVEKQLNETLTEAINPRFITKEDIDATMKEIEAETYME